MPVSNVAKRPPVFRGKRQMKVVGEMLGRR